MSTENYNYYRFDGVGRLHEMESLRAANDEDAVAQAYALHPGAICEIWAGERLVAKLGPNSASDMVARSRHVIDEARRVLSETAGIVSETERRATN